MTIASEQIAYSVPGPAQPVHVRPRDNWLDDTSTLLERRARAQSADDRDCDAKSFGIREEPRRTRGAARQLALAWRNDQATDQELVKSTRRFLLRATCEQACDRPTWLPQVAALLREEARPSTVEIA
jgi:hypothetical protein